MEFKQYQKIKKLGHEETEGILNGTVHIFPMLDGSNGSIWSDGGLLEFGARKRIATMENDNQDFAKEMLNSKVLDLLNFFKQYPDLRLYGEWLVPHTIKNYTDDAWRKFWIFDVRDNDDRYLPYEEYKPKLLLYGLHYVQPLIIASNPTENDIEACVKNNSILMKNGFNGEGVVIKNYDWINDGHGEVWAKVLSEEFLKKADRKIKPKINMDNATEDKIVKNYVTNHLIDKTVAKVKNDSTIPDNGKPFAMLSMVFTDFMEEELNTALKKMKYPTVNFRVLQKLIFNRVKEIHPQLF